jgi:hypothetical protein
VVASQFCAVEGIDRRGIQSYQDDVKAVEPVNEFEAEIGETLRPAVIGEITDRAVNEQALGPSQIDGGEILGGEGAVFTGDRDDLSRADVGGERHLSGVKAAGFVVEVGVGVGSGVGAEGQGSEVDGGSVGEAEDGFDAEGSVAGPDSGRWGDGAGNVVEHRFQPIVDSLTRRVNL